MKGLFPYTINVGGDLLDLSEPQVMGILNVTPDSFYEGSRKQTEADIAARTEQILEEGGDMIDLGACSTRPGAEKVTPEEEMRRLRTGLKTVRATAPKAILSVDTYRADAARMCVEEFGVQIINDISGGQMDDRMFPTVAELGVPYILTHLKGNLLTMQQIQDYDDLLTAILTYFGGKVQELHELGVKDIILDPGFGFGKSLEGNYKILSRLEDLKVLELPMLAGFSRKSMVHQLLDCSPKEALNGTTVLNTIALLKGACILRVHDVRACREAVSIVKKMLAC